MKHQFDYLADEHFDCEWPNCGRPATSEIVYRDRKLGDVYQTTRCDLHTLQEDRIDRNAMPTVRRLVVQA